MPTESASSKRSVSANTDYGQCFIYLKKDAKDLIYTWEKRKKG